VKAEELARFSIKEAKRKFDHKLAENVKNDAKSFYAYVRSKSTSRVGVGPLTSNSGERSVTDKEMCKAFNEYFSTVYTVKDTGNVPNAQKMFSGTKEEELSDLIITQEMVADRHVKTTSR